MLKQQLRLNPLISRIYYNPKVTRQIHSDQRSNASVLSVEKNVATDDKFSAVDWNNAKPFSSIPGPTKAKFLKDLLPFGKFYKKPFQDMSSELQKDYGDILKLPALLKDYEMIMLFNANHVETIFRTEGIWPRRIELETLTRYRRVYRKDFYKDNAGLIIEAGEKWREFRSKVNPIMMMPKTVKRYIEPIDEVAIDFVKHMKTMRDENNEMPKTFDRELNLWALESISTISLDKRLGLIGSQINPEAEHFIKSVRNFFELSYALEFTPSLWRYFDTPDWKKLRKTFDDISEFVNKHIDSTMNDANFNSKDGDSVLQKLLKIDRHAALVMVSDTLFAGVDTTAAYTNSVLYNLATHPDKQEKLREEVMRILPTKESRLTPESLDHAPYLRACLKEALRLNSVTVGNARITGQDIVLDGYQIPKGTAVMLSLMHLQLSEKHYERSMEFIPERWLKGENTGCPVKSARDTNPFTYLPFGFGPRSCVGKRFAELETETLILRILREFKVEWNYGPMEYNVGFIMSPQTPLKYTVKDL